MNRFAVNITLVMVFVLFGSVLAYKNGVASGEAHKNHGSEASHGATAATTHTTETKTPEPAHETAAAGNAEKGKELYASCAACHGAAGEGGIGAVLAKGEATKWTTEEFKTALATGKTPTKQLQEMMPKFAQFSDEQIADLHAYIKSL